MATPPDISYSIGLILGSFVLVGFLSWVVTLFWNRPVLAPLAVGMVGTALYYFATGLINFDYIVAGLIWAGVGGYRRAKKREECDRGSPGASRG